jgi:hypothetical protein
MWLIMLKKCAQAADPFETSCRYSFRATGISAYLKYGGTTEKASQIDDHESPGTTDFSCRAAHRKALACTLPQTGLVVKDERGP